MKSLELKKFISIDSYDEKSNENYQNCYIYEKRILPNYINSRSKGFIAKIEDLNKDCIKFHVPIFYTFGEIVRQNASLSGRAGPGRVELHRV